MEIHAKLVLKYLSSVWIKFGKYDLRRLLKRAEVLNQNLAEKGDFLS